MKYLYSHYITYDFVYTGEMDDIHVSNERRNNSGYIQNKQNGNTTTESISKFQFQGNDNNLLSSDSEDNSSCINNKQNDGNTIES